MFQAFSRVLTSTAMCDDVINALLHRLPRDYVALLDALRENTEAVRAVVV
jgi:hypothetical protein